MKETRQSLQPPSKTHYPIPTPLYGHARTAKKAMKVALRFAGSARKKRQHYPKNISTVAIDQCNLYDLSYYIDYD